MEPLDALYKEEGWDKVFPKSLIDIASKDGKPYSVPVNIHRSNMLWYNKKMLDDIGAKPPKTWDEFFVVAEKLKAKGIPALAIAENAAGLRRPRLRDRPDREHGAGQVRRAVQRHDEVGRSGHQDSPWRCSRRS